MVSMIAVFHVLTNAGPWKHTSVRLSEIDAALHSSGSIPIDLDWNDLEMDDPDHFTDVGAVEFAGRFVRTVVPHLRGYKQLYVLTDSTIDYNDRTVGGEWHGRASKYVESLFLKHDINASVDAVCGSGFVAGASDGQHFRNRLLNHLSHSLPSAILFMGGWNDVHRPRVHVLNAIYNCVSIAQSGRKRRALPVQYDP